MALFLNPAHVLPSSLTHRSTKVKSNVSLKILAGLCCDTVKISIASGFELISELLLRTGSCMRRITFSISIAEKCFKMETTLACWPCLEVGAAVEATT
jgi:hypothetical protein